MALRSPLDPPIFITETTPRRGRFNTRANISGELFGRLRSLEDYYGDKAGLIPAINPLIAKLQGDLSDGEFDQTCQQLWQELVKDLQRLKPSPFNRIFSHSPFFDEASFTAAFTALIESLSTEYHVAKIWMVYICINLYHVMQHNGNGVSPGMLSSKMITLASFGQYCDEADRVVIPLTQMLSSGLGMDIDGVDNADELCQKIYDYADSPLSKDKFDLHMILIHNFYNRRSWDKDDENIRLQHEQFVKALAQLRHLYLNRSKENLSATDKDQFDTVMQQTASMLSKLSFHVDEKLLEPNLQTIREYEAFCIANLDQSKFGNFFKAVGAVILTGLAYISVIGAARAHQKKKDVVDVAKEMCGLSTRYSLSRYLTFKPTGLAFETENIHQLAKNVAENAVKSYMIFK